MPEEIPLVRVSRDRYMSEAEAYANGYKPRLDPPTKGAPFFSPDAFWNLLFVVAVVVMGHYIHRWIGGVVNTVFSAF